MKLKFYKYQGTGNDFVMIDDREGVFPVSDVEIIKHLCDRRFGIGADGLILLHNAEGYDFKMVYFNADGNESSMCGNGGRCLVKFAKDIGVIEHQANFIAIDGAHQAEVSNNQVKLKMVVESTVEKIGDDFFIDTGSPHYVSLTDNVKDLDVFNAGRAIRNNDRFKAEGTNVNFVEELSDNEIFVRTYERGVEDETLSCGTGVTACSLVYGIKKNINRVKVKSPGGHLEVSFDYENDVFSNVYLEGPAVFVYSGEVEI